MGRATVRATRMGLLGLWWGREQLSGEVDSIFTAVADSFGYDGERLFRYLFGQFENHGQIDAGHHLNLGITQEHRRYVHRRAAEHVGEQQDTPPLRHACDSAFEFMTRDVDV